MYENYIYIHTPTCCLHFVRCHLFSLILFQFYWQNHWRSNVQTVLISEKQQYVCITDWSQKLWRPRAQCGISLPDKPVQKTATRTRTTARARRRGRTATATAASSSSSGGGGGITNNSSSSNNNNNYYYYYNYNRSNNNRSNNNGSSSSSSSNANNSSSSNSSNNSSNNSANTRTNAVVTSFCRGLTFAFSPAPNQTEKHDKRKYSSSKLDLNTQTSCKRPARNETKTMEYDNLWVPVSLLTLLLPIRNPFLVCRRLT